MEMVQGSEASGASRVWIVALVALLLFLGGGGAAYLLLASPRGPLGTGIELEKELTQLGLQPFPPEDDEQPRVIDYERGDTRVSVAMDSDGVVLAIEAAFPSTDKPVAALTQRLWEEAVLGTPEFLDDYDENDVPFQSARAESDVARGSWSTQASWETVRVTLKSAAPGTEEAVQDPSWVTRRPSADVARQEQAARGQQAAKDKRALDACLRECQKKADKCEEPQGPYELRPGELSKLKADCSPLRLECIADCKKQR